MGPIKSDLNTDSIDIGLAILWEKHGGAILEKLEQKNPVERTTLKKMENECLYLAKGQDIVM